MTTTKQTLRESFFMRWTTLVIVSLTMVAAYYVNDVMAPLKTMLTTDLGWSNSDYGFFTGGYSFLNVFFLMIIWGGLMLDKFGIRLTGNLSVVLMLVGTLLKYYALSHPTGSEVMLLGYRADVMYAFIGYSLFGVGAEVAGITITKVIAKWFRGKELATAMGIQVALARIGSQVAYSVSAPIAKEYGSVAAPVLIGLVVMAFGAVAFFVFDIMDRKLDQQESYADEDEESKFSFADVKNIFVNPGFWLISVLCVLFYSCVFPFQKYATELMITKYGVAENLAGTVAGLPALGALFLTPLFGGIYDKKGKGATIMIIGSVMLIFVHGIYTLPFITASWVAVGLMLILGVAFSLVPSAMWPAVAKIFPERQLGTAYALIFFIQNIGLWGVPTLIGWVLDKYSVDPTTGAIDYTLPMTVFTTLAIVSLFVALLLKREDKKRGYNLELPNAQS